MHYSYGFKFVSIEICIVVHHTKRFSTEFGTFIPEPQCSMFNVHSTELTDA